MKEKICPNCGRELKRYFSVDNDCIVCYNCSYSIVRVKEDKK